MKRAQVFYALIRDAVFHAFLTLEWKREDSDACFFESAVLCERNYNESLKHWQSLKDAWPKQPAVRIGWIARRSAAEASLLWVQDIALAISSLRQHVEEHGSKSAAECHSLLIEAISEWHEPEMKGLVAQRMEAMSRLEAEFEVICPSGLEKSKHSLIVDYWPDLSVGLDKDKVAWAVTPPATIGQLFPKSKAVRLKLPEGQLKSLLLAFADSLDGQTIAVTEALDLFDRAPPTVKRMKDRRAKPGEIDAADRAELLTELPGAVRSLKGVLKELRRTFREQVYGPSDVPELCFYILNHDVCSAFPVRWLLPTAGGRFTFGAPGSGG